MIRVLLENKRRIPFWPLQLHRGPGFFEIDLGHMTKKIAKTKKLDLDEVSPAGKLSTSFAARVEEWLTEYSDADVRNPSDRAGGHIRNIKKCGLTRQNGLAVVGIKQNKRAVLLNGRSCNDTACSVCARKFGAKSTEETRRVIERCYKDGVRVAFCVLSKNSPGLDLFREIEAAKSPLDEQKIWEKWQRHIGHSIHVACRARELLGNWLRSLPEEKRPRLGMFPEVVFPFRQRPGGRDNFYHAHFHLNALWFFPTTMSIEDIFEFRAELYRRWNVSVTTAFTEEKDSEDRLTFAFDYYKRMVSEDKEGQKIYTDESAFYFKLL